MSTLLITMLFTHLLCNANAEIRPLSQEEATFCSSNFEDLKSALNPDIERHAFQRMDLREKAKVSVESYQSYKTWLTENQALVDRMRTTAKSIARNSPIIF